MELEFRQSKRLTEVHELRKTVAGRLALVDSGTWTKEQAEARRQQIHAKRTRNAKNKVSPFVAWDGEGVTTKDGQHRYVLMCNSKGETLTNPDGLRTRETLLWILQSVGRDPNAINVAFGASYDANMILGTLSRKHCEQIARTGSTHWQTFRIEYRPRKELLVTRYARGRRHVKGNKVGISFQLWDVFGFFQCSFVEALKAWNIGIEDVTNIVEMKGKRSTFTLAEIPRMRDYCWQECKALVFMMDELRERCARIDLVPTRWDGAGALGTRLLGKYGVRAFMAPTLPLMQYAVQGAYYGGRIELIQWGNYEGKVFSHDIKSAYPWAATKLPCLAHGTWKKTTNVVDGFALYRVTFRSNPNRPRESPFYPLPIRTRNKSVHFVGHSTGWHWAPEIIQAQKHCRDTWEIEIHEGWIWEQECNHKPFAFLEELFAFRKELQAAQTFAEKVIKLAINSVYGKLAQRVGYSVGDSGKIPAYHQLEWAGYITALTRARMYELAMKSPEAVISFETDGLYATKQLAKSGDGTLGSWEVEEHTSITYIQSGFYFLQSQGKWKDKHRGFDPCKCSNIPCDCGAISRDGVLEAWRNGLTKLSGNTTRFQGMILCSRSESQFQEWKTWPKKPRELKLIPMGKRTVALMKYRPPRKRKTRALTSYVSLAATQLLPSQARLTWGIVEESEIHSLPWVTSGDLSQFEEAMQEEIYADAEDYT